MRVLTDREVELLKGAASPRIEIAPDNCQREAIYLLLHDYIAVHGDLTTITARGRLALRCHAALLGSRNA